MNKKIEKHKSIIKKITEIHADLKSLRTHNDKLNTVLFDNYIEFNNPHSIQLSDDELPILECSLPNGNYILATTENLYSIYNNTNYKMNYKSFKSSDTNYFRSNKQIGEGKTIKFKYLLKDSESFFMYEIDSLDPADIIHNLIVLNMRFGRYDN